MEKYKFVVLECSLESVTDKWEKSCKKYDQEYLFVDITQHNWLEKIIEYKPDCCLLRPPGNLSYTKQMYDERIFIINKVLNIPVYPSYEEAFIYENKRLLSYYLKAKEISHPDTFVFYNKKDALGFSRSSKLPIVAKTNIGAAGSGVKIINTEKELLKYCHLAFTHGIQRRRGPNKNSGNRRSWTKKAIASPNYFFQKLKEYKIRSKDVQKNFMILQEFIPHDFEWRVVKIGESYFAHKKTKIGEMASGTKNKIYDNPPLSLFDFMKSVCDKTGFFSQAVDIFETPNGEYLVNEIQTIFGQSDSFQMKVDGKIGRYVYKNGWVFEEGDFNSNESYDLRLEHAIKLFNEGRK